MMANQKPSILPADEASLTGVIKTAVNKAMQNFDVMLPVEVVAYDRATNRATVKHLVQMQGSDGEKVSRANVASVRVQQPGNGTFNISLPITPGDKGWLMAADRDMSVFQQGLTEDAPNTARMHSFQDGLFMPDAMSNGDAPAGQSGRVVIGANNGGAYMAFDGDGFYFNIGGTEFTLTAAGFAQTGGTVTHNGTDIGDTHIHDGVTPGGGNTGTPV
jgi:hypothetical protein